MQVDRLTGVDKNMTRGIVALVYRCTPLGGHAPPMVESVAVDRLSPEQVPSA